MKRKNEEKTHTMTTANNTQFTTTISGIAVLGLLTQIVLMYLGTICHRTLDQKGGDLLYSDWLPPKLTAVHYALLDPFAARDNFLVRFLIATPALTASLTFATIVVEGCVPLVLCWMLWNRRHTGALILCGLHAGLLLVLNLPTWQYVGMLTQVVWIPTPVWDGWLLQLNKNEKSEDDTAAAAYKKTDGDTTTSTDPTIHTPPQSSSSSSLPPPPPPPPPPPRPPPPPQPPFARLTMFLFRVHALQLVWQSGVDSQARSRRYWRGASVIPMVDHVWDRE